MKDMTLSGSSLLLDDNETLQDWVRRGIEARHEVKLEKHEVHAAACEGPALYVNADPEEEKARKSNEELEPEKWFAILAAYVSPSESEWSAEAAATGSGGDGRYS